jgi:hypothetical protein
VLLLDPLDSGALLRCRLQTELLERLLHVFHVLPGLVEMALEAEGELLVRSFLLQLRQGLHESALGVEHVAELVEEQLARLVHLGGHQSPLVVVCRGLDERHFAATRSAPDAANRRLKLPVGLLVTS